MVRLADLAIRRPVPTLLVWIAIAAALALAGFGVSDQVSPSIYTVAGSQSSREQTLANDKFGAGVLVPVLLQGPQAQLDQQGPQVVRRLAARGDTRVMSAWDTGPAAKALRPSPTSAMVVASVAHNERDMVATYQKQIDETVRSTISGPVHEHITGQPTLDIAAKNAAIDATRTASLVALPILLVVLLFLLGRPVAAVMITATAGTVVLMSFGVLAILGRLVDIDPAALALASLTGLALGVGYTLVVVRRFLDLEGPAGSGRTDDVRAATQAVATSGRALLFGGTVLIACLVLAVLIAPTEILMSLGIGVLVSAALAVGGAVAVMPALLVLLGHRLDLLRATPPRVVRGAWDRLVGAGSFVTRRAVWTGAAATAVLAVLAIPATSIETGPPDVSSLPAGNQARQDFETVAQVMGPGWPTPYNVLVVSNKRPITDTQLLAAIDRYQREIARDPRVDSVAGPGEFRAQTKPLGKLPKSLRDSSKLLKGGKRDLGRLENGLGQAGAGAQQLRSGLEAAASGANQLHSGSGQAGGGASQLHAGLAAARIGAAKISSGLNSALTGAEALRAGAGKALAGSKQLTGGLGQAAKPVQQGAPVVKQMANDISSASASLGPLVGSAQATTSSLDEAITKLQAQAGTDPQVASALAAVQSARDQAAAVSSGLGSVQSKVSGASGVATAFAGQTSQLASGLGQLLAGSTQLQSGIAQLRSGNSQLAGGIARLSSGGGQLTTGLTALRNGAGQLESGLGQLTTGSGQLASGLSAGTGPTGQLVSGLGQMQAGVAKFRGQLPSPKDLEQLQRQSPGLFDSGYFVLAAIAGAPPSQREQASFAVNLERGGSAGQIVVIPRYASSDQRTRELGATLRDSSQRFAAATGTETAVGGPAGNLADYHDTTAARVWVVVAALAALAAVLLMLMLRTVVLPLVAVAFDLLAAGAAFGILSLIYVGDDPIGGGPGYLEPMGIIGLFAAVFGLTVVYEVALLERAREVFLRTDDPREALRVGLRSTAWEATGAAVAMVAAIIPFMLSDLITLRQFGIGVAAVVILDAFIVRPVLLPAAVTLLGRWCWWPTSRRARRGRATPSAPAPA